MQIGSSVVFDLGVCLALGIASASCMGSSIAARGALRRHRVSPALGSFARLCSLLLHLGGIIAIAAALGQMQSSLHRYSLLAYPLGIVLLLPLVIDASRHEHMV